MNAASRPKAAHKKSVRPTSDARARDMLTAAGGVEGRVEITATYPIPIPPDALAPLWALIAGGVLHVEGRRVQISRRFSEWVSDDDHDARLVVDQLIDALPHDLESITVQWNAFHPRTAEVPTTTDDLGRPPSSPYDDDIPV